MDKIKLGIVGYGNLGRGVECAAMRNEDMEVTAIYTRREPKEVQILTADAQALTGVWFDGQKYYAQGQADLEPEAGAAICNAPCKEEHAPLLADVKRWLDIYFAGKEPDFDLPLNPTGTDFQKSVWSILCTIPYGKTMTYGQIAAQIAAERGIARMSAQAVGGAVGHNPLSIIVPCHRVVGMNGSLTGYGGGIDRKIKLLTLEGIDMNAFFVPKKGTAL